MATTWVRRSATWLPTALLLSGCYASIPVEPTAVPPGEEVVVYLGADAIQRLSLDAGYMVRSLRGTLEQATDDSVSISVWSGTRYQGVVVSNFRRHYHFSRPEVVLMERREFQRERTALVGLGVLGALAYLLSQIRGGEGGSGPGDGGEPPPPAPDLIPITIR